MIGSAVLILCLSWPHACILQWTRPSFAKLACSQAFLTCSILPPVASLLQVSMHTYSRRPLQGNVRDMSTSLVLFRIRGTHVSCSKLKKNVEARKHVIHSPQTPLTLQLFTNQASRCLPLLLYKPRYQAVIYNLWFHTAYT